MLCKMPCNIAKKFDFLEGGKLCHFPQKKNTFATHGRKEPGKKKIEPALYPGLCFGSLSIIDNGAEY